MTLGEKIKILRKEKGLTQEELGKKLNTTKQTIGKYEKGIVTNIPLSRILDIAQVLDCDASDLIEWKHSDLYDNDMLESIKEDEQMLQNVRDDLQRDDLSESERDDLEESEYILEESIEGKKFALSQGRLKQKTEPSLLPEEELDKKLVSLLTSLTPEETQKVVEFALFLKSNRKD